MKCWGFPVPYLTQIDNKIWPLPVALAVALPVALAVALAVTEPIFTKVSLV
jgi:hypothetical protein